ncbi:MAG: hypothetical protein F9K47_16950, partial [Burkholderiales bacterium]
MLRLKTWLGALASWGALASVALAAYPPGAGFNDPARGWDHLWHEVIVDITVLGVIFAVITAWFVVRIAAPVA